MSITLDIRDGNFVLSCPARYREFAKQIPGLKFRNLEDAYIGPVSWTAAQVIQGLFVSHGLTYTPEVIEWATTEAARIGQIQRMKSGERPTEIARSSRTGKTLRPWQADDAFVLSWLGRAMDLSDRGTGKTPKLITALRLAQEQGKEIYPHLMVTRPLALDTAREEWLEWMPDLTPEDIVVMHGGGTKQQRTKLLAQDAKVFILPYHLVPLHGRIAKYGTNTLTEAQKTPKELNGRFKSALVDEAHRLIYQVGAPNIQTRSIWAILDELDLKFLATGSPIADAPDDLWSLLRALWPDEFSSSTRYKDRYCNMVPQFFGPDRCTGVRPDTADEWRQIMAPKFVQRLKEDVLTDLPPKAYEIVTSPLEGKQATYYKQLTDKGVVKIGEYVMIATNEAIKREWKLKFAFGTPVLGIKKNPKGEEYVAPVSLTMPSNKIDALLETFEAHPNTPMIVWVSGRLELDLCAQELEKAGISFVQFAGGMKPEIREDGRKRFQAGDVRVALCLLQVASEALTLTAAPVALYLQREDNMIDSTQSEDRIHRIGQTQEVLVIDHLSEGTVEFDVHENYLAKERRSNEAFQITREQRSLNEVQVS